MCMAQLNSNMFKSARSDACAKSVKLLLYKFRYLYKQNCETFKKVISYSGDLPRRLGRHLTTSLRPMCMDIPLNIAE